MVEIFQIYFSQNNEKNWWSLLEQTKFYEICPKLSFVQKDVLNHEMFNKLNRNWVASKLPQALIVIDYRDIQISNYNNFLFCH